MESGSSAPPSRSLLLGVLSVIAAALLPSTAGLVSPIDAHARTSQIAYPELLQDGDLVFRTGMDVRARLVLAHGKESRFSHVGIVIHTTDGWAVFHSTPAEPGMTGGVHAELLEDFTSNQVAAQVGFFRIDGLNEEARQRIKEYLLSQLGKPFDYRFQYSDDSAHYCTELVLKAFRNAGIDLEPSMTRVQVLTLPEAAIPPDSLLLSPSLRELTPNPRAIGAPTAGHQARRRRSHRSNDGSPLSHPGWL